MENAECRNHANSSSIGSFDLGMENAERRNHANLWGALGMLAWVLLPAYGMPTILARGMLLECWHGECYQHMVCQLYWHGSCYMGSLSYWHDSCYQQLPCQKKSSIRVHFVLDISTKIWYNGRLDFWKWGACAEKSFSKFLINSAIWFFKLYYIITLRCSFTKPPYSNFPQRGGGILQNANFQNFFF